MLHANPPVAQAALKNDRRGRARPARHAVALFLAIVLATVLAWAGPARAGEVGTYMADSEDVRSMGVFDNIVVWASARNCPGGEFAVPCRVRKYSAGATDGIWASTLYVGETDFVVSNFAADDTHVWWASSSGEILRQPHNISRLQVPPEPVAVVAKQDPNTFGEVAVNRDWIFWTENVSGSAGQSGKLYRAPHDGAFRELLAESADSSIRRLRADQQGGILFITSIESTFCCFDILQRISAEGVLETADYQLIDSYTLSDTAAYWITRDGAGFGPEIRTAPLSNLRDDSLVMVLPGDDELRWPQLVFGPERQSFECCTRDLYWQERRGGSGPLHRLDLDTGESAPITDNLGRIDRLSTASRALFWTEGGAIFRLDRSAEALVLDLVGNEVDLEVVQVIQNADHDIPLVSGKPTLVRAYGRIGTSAEGVDELFMSQAMLLYGERPDGSALPGSPLRPVDAPRTLTRDPIDRTNLDNTFLFRLPQSWTHGEIRLRSVLNPNFTRVETDFANNVSERNVVFEDVQGLCLEMLLVSTHAGTSQPGVWTSLSAALGRVMPHLRRARSLLPVHEIRPVFNGGPPRRRPLIGDPYNMRETTHKHQLMMNLSVEFTLSGAPSQCGDYRTIRTVMVPDSDRFGLSYYQPFIYFLEDNGDGGVGPVNQPLGGVSGAAHEIGHQLGRAHVRCPKFGDGRPDGTDSNYPYDSCELDASNNHIGLDSISRGLIVPFPDEGDRPGDYMSYTRAVQWASDYTYRATYDVLKGGFSPSAVASSGAPAGPEPLTDSATPAAMIVAGFVSDDGAASISHAWGVSGAALDGVAGRIMESSELIDGFVLELLDQAGEVVEREPLTGGHIETEIEAGAGPESHGFVNLIAARAGLSGMRVVREADNAVLAERVAGTRPPQVIIHAPVAGDDIAGDRLDVNWTGTDPDGDALLYQVRYSPDNGATWMPLASGLDETELAVDLAVLPGGEQALIEVAASDGINSSHAFAGPFRVASRAPEAAILAEDGSALGADEVLETLQSRPSVLLGLGFDAEDGVLPDSALSWEILGPVTTTAEGSEISTDGLPPGRYEIHLVAEDSDLMIGSAMTGLNIPPKAVVASPAPVVDGACHDPAYAADPDPVSLRYADGAVAEVRFIHSGDALNACFSGLPLAGEGSDFVSLRFDVDNSGGEVMEIDDLLFVAAVDGAVLSGGGDGAGNDVFDPISDGLTATVGSGEFTWNAELRIDADRLLGRDRLVRMQVAHHWQSGEVAAASTWPVGSGAQLPESWGLTALGEAGAPAEPEPVDPFARGIEEIAALQDRIDAMDLRPPGIPRSLGAKLEVARKALERDDLTVACNALDAFVSQVEALHGKQIESAIAAELETAAREIQMLIGCPI